MVIIPISHSYSVKQRSHTLKVIMKLFYNECGRKFRYTLRGFLWEEKSFEVVRRLLQENIQSDALYFVCFSFLLINFQKNS